jgi:hypothetical protein
MEGRGVAYAEGFSTHKVCAKEINLEKPCCRVQ